MACYDAGAWRLYRQGRVEPKRRQLMEKHLRRCARCLETYAGAIEAHEAELGELLLRPDFNDRVVHLVRAGRRRQLKTRRRRLLVNYVTAASLTLALMAGGVFDQVLHAAPSLVEGTGSFIQSLHETAIFTWPSRLLLDTTDRLDRLWKIKED